MHTSHLFKTYKWQLITAPFFIVSLFIALTLNATSNRHEFIIISVLYTLADILTVNFFTCTKRKTRGYSLAGAVVIFFSVFLYTFWVHKEIQYIFTQPLFLIAGWKSATRELKPTLYPAFLNEPLLTKYCVFTIIIAVIMYAQLDVIPTYINLVQLIGLSMFGLFIATGSDIAEQKKARMHMFGTIGISIYTLCCLGDVWYKWYMSGDIIATPFVAFFASVPVVIVALKEDIPFLKKFLHQTD